VPVKSYINKGSDVADILDVAGGCGEYDFYVTKLCTMT